MGGGTRRGLDTHKYVGRQSDQPPGSRRGGRAGEGRAGPGLQWGAGAESEEARRDVRVKGEGAGRDLAGPGRARQGVSGTGRDRADQKRAGRDPQGQAGTGRARQGQAWTGRDW